MIAFQHKLLRQRIKILTCQYDDIKNVTGNNCYAVVENGKLEIINSYGKVILNSGFDAVKDIGLDLFIVTNNGKYSLIDKEGKVIINPEYDDLRFCIADYYIAKKGEKYGIINKEGNNVIDFSYNSVNYIKEGNFFSCEKENFVTDIIDSNFEIKLSDIIISDLNLTNHE